MNWISGTHCRPEAQAAALTSADNADRFLVYPGGCVDHEAKKFMRVSSPAVSACAFDDAVTEILEIVA